MKKIGNRALFAASLSLAVLVISCAKIKFEAKKFPPSIPTVKDNSGRDTIDPSVTRAHISDLVISESGLAAAFKDLGLYDPDVCISWVKYTKGNQPLGDLIEFANYPCIGSLIPIENVVQVVKQDQDPQFFTNYYLRDEVTGFPLGKFRKMINDGVTSYQLEELCDVRGEYDIYCKFQLENNLFRSFPGPIELTD